MRRSRIEDAAIAKDGQNSTTKPPTGSKAIGPLLSREFSTYAHAQIPAHPYCSLIEGLLSLMLRFSEASRIPEDRLEVAGLIFEIIALAFSFPNLTGFNTDLSDEASVGKFFELLGFGCRILEVFMEGAFFLLKKKLPDRAPSTATRAKFRIGLTIFEFAFNLIAAAVRLDTSAFNGPEYKAAGIACANAFTSLGEQMCSLIADVLLKEVPPAPAGGWLLIAAAAFAGCDTLLDAGRGTYEWRTEKPNIQLLGANGSPLQGGSHEIAFRKRVDGLSEVVVMVDLVGTHQVVSY